ncbi:MAG: CDP-diacylglycerol--serine O-phosphatidyltransferase [Cardiobacteriaceae bacterium]|nr:CDP-diacylglycerol--serine O-phosphatidyltransferase [Cardiobacteriaceae bacterium]
MRGFKAIYLLPNLFTTAALFCGYYAIICSLNGLFGRAALAIFIAMICDGLDGRVARWTHTESAFGVQYDSLADLISFGLAPALLMYQWVLKLTATLPNYPNRLGLLVAFLYLACTAIRLARFNTQAENADKSIFIGLPSPSAAAVVAGYLWLGAKHGWNPEEQVGMALVLTTLVAFAMISDLYYYSFKTFKPNTRLPRMKAILPALIIFAIMLDPPITLFTIFSLYALHAPLWWAWRIWQRKQKPQKP